MMHENFKKTLDLIYNILEMLDIDNEYYTQYGATQSYQDWKEREKQMITRLRENWFKIWDSLKE